MKRINLTGLETKRELVELLTQHDLGYGKYDNKETLLSYITEYNELVDSIVKNKEKEEKKTIVPEKIIDGLTFCEMRVLGKRSKFFIEKKYKREKKTIVEWEDCLKKDRILN